MKKLIISLIAALLAFATLPVTAFAADHHVVFQVSDADVGKWGLALANIHNLQVALGKDNVEIELVVFGPGIDMVVADSLVGNRIEDTLATGVKIIACENTMKGLKLQRSDMASGISYVPAGVVQIIDRQKQGWAYIRP